MKILHINCNYVGTALHRVMMKHLNMGSCEVIVFTPLWSENQEKEFHANKNEILSVCFGRFDKLFYYAKQRKIIRAIKKKINDIGQFDVIHAFTLMTDGNVAYKLSKEFKIPYFVAIRDTDINYFFRYKPYLRPKGIRIMHRANAVFFLSDTYREYVLDRFVPLKYREKISEKCFVVPNGIDDFWFQNKYNDKPLDAVEKRLAEKKLSVICVGKIIKRKNIPVLQKALQLLRDRGWEVEFNLIGKAEDKSEYEIIKKDQYTVCHPATNKEGLIDYYRKADIFVLVSHTETFGLVYAEAMSQGLPVIYTRGQGFDGQFQEGEVGYAVSDDDPNEIADAIMKVCADYSNKVHNALNDVDKFRWDDISNRYRDFYERAEYRENQEK